MRRREGFFLGRESVAAMLKQEWGYEYLGHLRSPQQPIEVRHSARLPSMQLAALYRSGLVVAE